ncbi:MULTISPECIES: hypothetical protein [Haloarcula]|uniref:hypothetical protein n=1 Tax=Haloarcula TaxID=2237 RepID=UPI0023EB896A|nr:hypothetical protein [Halomicroarcula sp. XH51]
MADDMDHPDPPDSLPEDIVEFVQSTDIHTLDDLGGYVERELTARANATLEDWPE